MPTYPNPCCRCGFCCLSETCPAGQDAFGVGKHDPCPALSFEGDFHVDPVTLAAVENPGPHLAVCALAVHAPNPEWAAFFIGVGQGCCIKARAIAKGVTYDFAMLPPHVKRALARGAR